MKAYQQQIIREMREGRLSGSELEEKESVLLQELRCAADEKEIRELCSAIAVSGSILSVPCLFALMQNWGDGLKPLFENIIKGIAQRAKGRGSRLPSDYYTLQHWQPQWQGSKTRFLSYVSAIADIVVKNEDNDEEVKRIGNILVKEMQVDISPYNNFQDFKICIHDWDFEEDYKLVLDRMEQERLVEEIEDAGLRESWNTFFADHLLNLKYDYLVTRLGIADKFEYHQFVLKMAECLNISE
ncbi:MAG: hypothetical protein ABIX36_11290 [Mucilaginibacter sp.]|uniref:hypothetical protein n=1 Tax=Mucilaginibacter sp. TaxID=1882438 RepID=UPI003263282A